MFMRQNHEFGITTNILRKDNKIAYCNSYRIKQEEYFVPSTGCAIDKINKNAILKSYNEFLERFRLGIGGLSKEKNCINYGFNEEYGAIDTTGTASGKISKELIYKAKVELIEKNEIFLFWYTNNANFYFVNQNKEIKKLIKSLNFVADYHILFCIKNLSNLHTILSLSFKENLLTGCGVAADLHFDKAIENSILENKLIEWQHFKNPNSYLYQNAVLKKDEIAIFIAEKCKQSQEIIVKNFEKEIVVQNWIKTPEIIILGNNKRDNIKSIKLISKDLLNCIPNNENISLSKNQTIITKYKIVNDMDCIIV